MKPAAPKLSPDRRYLLLAALLAVSLYVLLPQLGDFHSSWHLLRHPELSWAAAAIGLTALTYLAGAATYCLLAFKPLRYAQTALVQLAAMFINRLLPGGLGALGVNYAYLRRNRHGKAQAASVVAINNLLGALGHGLLVAVTLLLFSDQVKLRSGHSQIVSTLAKAAFVVAVVLIILGVVFGRQKFARKLADVRNQLLSYRRQPWRLPAALLSSMVLTLCNVLCLACCALALGVHLPFAAILLVFSFGIGTGTATPTPGGLGGFEAGLVTGFIAYGVAGPAALAAALLYRLISYWLPLPFGAVAFIGCQRRKLFSA